MNDSNKKTTSTGGITFVGALTLLFIALKLTGYIKWGWVWVLSPMWISFTVTLVVLVVFAILVSGGHKPRKR